MNLDRYLYPSLALSLAGGIVLQTYMTVSSGTVFLFLVALVLLLLAFYWLRQGHGAFIALCVFFLVLGLLRWLLPPVRLLPDDWLVLGDVMLSDMQAHLQALGLSSEAESLLAAMLWGHRDTLSPDTVALYRHVGASHILALSGLHLGILFGCLNFCMLRLLTTSWRYLFGWLSILLMWGYALLTGFPISLCRASLMLTFLTVSEMTFAGSEAWDTLGISALCLLLLHPFMLFDVGFQLSFAAVAGIVLYYRPVQRIFHPQNPFLMWLWCAWAVSFAAQVFALPLVLHYFRYVSLSGILMSPIYILWATAILLVGILLLCVSLWGGGLVLKMLLELLVSMQHGVMGFASRLPWGGLHVRTLSVSSVVLLYVALFCLLPPLYALRPSKFKPDGYRMAMFFRMWPYLLSVLILLMAAFLLA